MPCHTWVAVAHQTHITTRLWQCSDLGERERTLWGTPPPPQVTRSLQTLLRWHPSSSRTVRLPPHTHSSFHRIRSGHRQQDWRRRACHSPICREAQGAARRQHRVALSCRRSRETMQLLMCHRLDRPRPTAFQFSWMCTSSTVRAKLPLKLACHRSNRQAEGAAVHRSRAWMKRLSCLEANVADRRFALPISISPLSPMNLTSPQKHELRVTDSPHQGPPHWGQRPLYFRSMIRLRRQKRVRSASQNLSLCNRQVKRNEKPDDHMGRARGATASYSPRRSSAMNAESALQQQHRQLHLWAL